LRKRRESLRERTAEIRGYGKSRKTYDYLYQHEEKGDAYHNYPQRIFAFAFAHAFHQKIRRKEYRAIKNVPGVGGVAKEFDELSAAYPYEQ
jgi:hypothetical protein